MSEIERLMPPPYRILTAIGQRYQNEVGTEGERRAHLNRLETVLADTIAFAEAFAQRPAGPQVAQNLPELGQGRVKALTKFHTEQQQNVTRGDLLNAQVIKLRQWIFRQGAVLTTDGKIIWPKSQHVVQYDTDLARQNMTRIEIRNGLLCGVNGKALDTKFMVTAFSGPGHAIYVMSLEGHLHVSSHAVGFHHHSSLLAGGDGAGAGELRVSGGHLEWISNKSGHYRPDVFHLLQVLELLQDSGVPMAFRVQLHSAAGVRNYPTLDALMVDNHFDNDTLEAQTLWQSYAIYFTTRFLHEHPIALLSAGPHGRSGIYDMSANPPRRFAKTEFETLMRDQRNSPRLAVHLDGGGTRFDYGPGYDR
jgi:hypothetical protein